jgi:phosphoenolpyruvate-protein kinase (PTS system EI component)
MVKAHVRTLVLSEAQTLARQALNCATAAEVRRVSPGPLAPTQVAERP